MKSIRYILLLFLIIFSAPSLSETFLQAWSSCQYRINNNEDPDDVCRYYTYQQCVGSSGGTGQYGAVVAQMYYQGGCVGAQKWQVTNGPDCTGGKEWSNEVGMCVCPSGQIELEGICQTPPQECTSEQVGYACGSQICTGSYVAPFSCFLTSAPAGCEAGNKSFSGCDLVCPGQSTPNANGTGCDDPVCSEGQYLENHSCVNSPTCIGEQTLNPQTNQCDEPTCGDGYGVNPTTHICEFQGCPSGMVQGQLEGSTVCVKSGQTTSGTQTTAGTSTGQQSTTTNNPDGSTSTSTTTTTSNTTSTTSIELDTGGLAQESTQVGILDELKKLNQGKSFEGQSGDSLYESNEKTYSGILGEFKNRITQAPIATVGNSFFDVQLSGSCPIWVLPATDLTPSIPIDMQCSDAMNSIWPLVAAVVIASASFIAFRWAFL